MNVLASQQNTAAKSPPVSNLSHPGLLLQRKCACGGSASSSLTGECEECKNRRLQKKLSIGASNDPLEQEADRVAEQVLAASLNSAVNTTPPKIQRFSGQANGGANTAPPIVDRVLAGSGRPLDTTLQQDMGQRFGHDFSQVRVHTGPAAEQSARDVNAHAYTVGSNVVFGAGRFAPSSGEGRRLIAHELTHVVQQGVSGISGGVQLMRETVVPTNAPPTLDYKRLAYQINKAIVGLGTDEEAVYRALQEIDRNQFAIDELKRVYLKEYKVPLLDDIYDDFSGEELEYALQLMNMGMQDSRQRVESASKGSIDLTLAVVRLREAVEGIGTDEEAIFAVLLQFNRNTLELQNEYYRRYKEDLRDRLIDEMSGSELKYGLELLETPYEYYLQEGNEKLASAPFGAFGDVSTICFPDERQTSTGGSKRIYWYDKDYWESGIDQQQRSCKVTLLPGKSPALAIDAMFEHQDHWKIACAEFVQIVHLYALRHTLGAKRFDQRVGSGGFTLEVRRRESTGVETDVVFSRKDPSEQMVRSDSGQPDPRSMDDILASAPIGSRVRWTNLSGIGKNQPNPWENENTIKLGSNKFGAHGTSTGIFSKTNTHTREEIELLTALGTNPNADASYVKANIYISEIGIFSDPMRSGVTS